jgi:putative membrane protein
MLRTRSYCASPIVVVASLALGGCAPVVPPPESMPAAPAARADGMRIIFAANAAALEDAEFALRRATHPAVRTLAGEVVRERSAMQQRLTELMSERGVDPQAGVATGYAVIRSGVAEQVFHPWRGMNLDRAYLEHHRRYTLWLVDTLDESLVPAARDPELRTFYESVRSQLAERAAAIERLQDDLVGWHA